MLHLDTSALIGALCMPKQAGSALRKRIDLGEPIFLSAPTLYEWQRGPRRPEELKIQEELFPSWLAIPFGPIEAAIAAKLYRSVKRPRGREVDLTIAACAISCEAQLWTLNPEDFDDIPGLTLAQPRI